LDLDLAIDLDLDLAIDLDLDLAIDLDLDLDLDLARVSALIPALKSHVLIHDLTPVTELILAQQHALVQDLTLEESILVPAKSTLER
jgi:hypothetical protein